tara:strand:- start:1690 stop:3393 length:1704 start_codon:yes stop_codon:yes gene_type:complete
MDWFTAAGSIFQGMYDKSKQYQKEDFVLRAEELKAERDSLINRKNKKYDLELEAYYKENEKKKEIDALNAQFGNSNVNEYATNYLKATDKYWGTYDANERASAVAKLAKSIEANGMKPITYKMQSQDPDKLANNLAAEEKLILKRYKEELQKSKDNNFLVNKVLGKSTSVDEKSLSDIVNAEKKASEVVINTSDDTEETGLTGEAADAPIRIKDDFDKAFGTQKGKLVYSKDSDLHDDSAQIMIAANLVGADGGGFFKFKDGKVTDITAEGRAFLDIYKTTYNSILNTYTVEDFAKLYPNQRVSEVQNLTKDEIHRLTTQAIEQRTINLDNTRWFDGKKDIKALIHLPFNVLDMKNQINGKQYNGTEVKNLYENFIREVVGNTDLQESRIQKLDNGEKTVAVQNSIMNDGAYKTMFLKYLEDSDIKPIEVAEVTTETNVDNKGIAETNTETNTQGETEPKGTGEFRAVRMNNGDIGITINGQVFSIKDNLETFKNNPKYSDPDLQKAISEAMKFGLNTETMSPNLNTIPEFITVNTRLGTRRIPNPEHPNNKKKKTITSKVNKKKLR